MAWSGWIFIGILVGGFFYAMRQTPQPKTLAIKDKQQFLDKLSQMFTEPTEEYKASLGGYYVIDYIENNILSEGFTVISNKKAYIKGECYVREGSKLKKSFENRMIELEDVKGTSYAKEDPKSIFIGGVIASVLAVASLVVTLMMEEPTLFINVLPLIILAIALTLFVIYRRKKVDLFEINFNGGSVAFNTEKYFASELDNFQAELELIQEDVVNGERLTELKTNK